MKSKYLVNVLIVLSVVFSCLTMMAVGVTVYQTMTDKPYLSYQNLPFPVVEPATGAFHPGDSLTYKVTRCNTQTTFKSFRVARMLEHESGANYILPSVVVPLPPDCSHSVSNITTLPEESEAGVPLPPGRYRIIGTSSIDGINQTFEVPWATEWFDVEAAI